MPASHKHDWEIRGGKPSVKICIEDWLGPVSGIFNCRDCQTPAFFHTIAWTGEGMRQRILAVRELGEEAFQTYSRNISRDYCDLERKQAETNALVHASSQDATLIAIDLPELGISEVSSGSSNPPIQPWQTLDPAEYDHWLTVLRG